MKRFIGWLILAARLHRSLRAARVAIGQVGRGPIRVRPFNPIDRVSKQVLIGKGGF
jgi:hypothetical protein